MVSQLHYFLDNHGLGEKHVHFHADNCTGQKKNNCMMQCLVWRVLTCRHTNITLSFLVVGHTKFAPDWCFGLFKRRYRRTNVGSLQSIAQVVNESADCNVSQLVAWEDGNMIVQTLNWTDFFAPHLKKIVIKKYHHFRTTLSAPGCVFVKEQSDSPELKIDLLKAPWNPPAHELPEVVPPKGLSAERQWYLREQIRPFCPDEDKDTVCPLPTVPKPGSRQGTPNPEYSAPPPKRRRVCGICKEVGHDK